MSESFLYISVTSFIGLAYILFFAYLHVCEKKALAQMEEALNDLHEALTTEGTPTDD